MDFSDSFIPIGCDVSPLLSLYLKYLENPDSVPLDWRINFEHQELKQSESPEHFYKYLLSDLEIAYQTFGHLSAKTDPLRTQKLKTATEIENSKLRLTSFLKNNENLKNQLASDLQIKIKCFEDLYCGAIGVEFSHILALEKREWLFNRYKEICSKLPSPEKRISTFKSLTKIDEFEKFCGLKYPTKKRFGSAGSENAICLMQNMFAYASKSDFEEIVIGGMHRGRLALLHNLLNKPAEELFAELNGHNFFTEKHYLIGDVPYHLGYSTDLSLTSQQFKVSLLPHPSHLLVVAACAMGKARAKKALRNIKGKNCDSTLCFLMHTDAAFSGQGVVSEILQLSELPGFSVGGTIHLIVNNQIGFTTVPGEARSSKYCTDVAKLLDAPILHVNSDDTDAIIQVARLALEWRVKFNSDIFIDFVCYRRFGHNELDEPTFTQPQMYKKIKDHPSVRELYRTKLNEDFQNLTEIETEVQTDCQQRLNKAFKAADAWKPNKPEWLTGKWSKIVAVDESSLSSRVLTGIAENQIEEIITKICSKPTEISIHPKVQKFLENRSKAFFTTQSLNWATAEALSLGSLLIEGHSVRISGQDSVRGTFTQRHWAFHDLYSDKTYFPLKNISKNQSKFEAYNSPLAEYSILSYEYGHSLVDPDQLTIWEAQFGDFANGAQIVVDQVIAASEARWRRMTGLVLLLPHGLEGQGPDHSSCRLERFLSLCADGNIIVANCTTPSNYFHLLRRQVKAKFRKPLIIATPKSLLRDRKCVSYLHEFCEGTYFKPVLRFQTRVIKNADVRRVILCSGKIKYELAKKMLASNGRFENVMLISIEQIYPFPATEVCELLRDCQRATVIWCQEEPKNQGCWTYIRDKIEDVICKVRDGATYKNKSKQTLRCIARQARPAPSGGSYNDHLKEEEILVDQALTI